jgi:two-component system, cell cycle sensor histidine kinase and response regulator CckA
MDSCRILVVEDEAVVAMDIQERLAKMGYEIAGHAANGAEALAMVDRRLPDLVLMDIRLKGAMDGIAVAEEMRRRYQLSVIFLTAFSEEETLDRAKRVEPTGYILKPFSDSELKTAIEMAFYRHRTQAQLQRMNRLFDTLSQVSQTIVRAQNREKLLPTVCRVLVERGGIDLAWIGRVDFNTSRIEPLAFFGVHGEFLAPIHSDRTGPSEGEIELAQAIREGQPYVSGAHLCRLCPYPTGTEPARQVFQSCASFPLQLETQVVGNLSLCSKEASVFGEKEINLFQKLATDISFALEKIEADTQRRSVEEALRESEARYRRIVDTANEGIWEMDGGYTTTYVNRVMAQMLGYEPSEMLGKPVTFFMCPEDLQDHETKMSARAKGLDSHYERRFKHKQGSEVWTRASGTALMDEQNRFRGSFGMFTDITALKRAEDIRQARSRLMVLAINQSLEDLLRATLDEAEALTGSLAGFYHFLGDDQETLQLQAWSTRTTRELCRAEGQGIHYPVDRAGVWVDCIRQRRPIIHNDYEALPHRKGMPSGHVPVLRELVVPVFRGDRIVAILGVGNKPQDYGEADVEAVSRLADLAWDIAEHKLAAESISERDRRMRTLLENLPGAAYRCANDREWTMEFVSQGCKGLTGYAPEDLIGNSRLSYNDLVHVDDREPLWDAWQDAISRKTTFHGEYRIVTRSGAVKWVWESGSPVFDSTGRLLALEGFVMDITLRRRAEESLRQSEERYRSVVEDAPMMIVTYLPDTTLSFVNDAFCKYFRQSREQLLDHRFVDWLSESDQQTVRKLIGSLTPEEPTRVWESEFKGPDGVIRFHRWTSRGIFDPAGQLVLCQGFGEDITEQKHSQADLQRLAMAIDQAGETIFITDVGGVIQYVNPAFERTTGFTREEALGQTPGILKSGRHTDAFYKELWKTLMGGKVWVGRFTNKKKDGTLFEEDAVISPVLDPQGRISQFVAVKRDVSKEVELETRLHQVQKMEAVGQLAGGVAHDFNNMLSPILGYAEMLLDDLHPADDRYDQVMQIKKAGERSRDLTRQLLAFSRKQVLQMRPVDLSQIVGNMEKLLRRTLREDIQLQISSERIACTVMADVGQIEQVLMNLVVNAQDAMPHGGNLTIRISRERLAETDCAHHPGMIPGNYGVLTVRDTGGGMSQDTLEHIFEPFYSTKGERGTGLGLATVYGVVKQHHGHILVDSEPGGGTTFRVYLPEAETAASTADNSRIHPLRVSGEETILVVEDDEMVLRMAAMLLTRQGYKVLTASSGAEAQQVLERHAGPIHLLLTDVIMPEMNGKELYERLSRQCAGLKVLYMSGYTDDVIARHGLLEDGIHLIQKPFTVRDLPVKIRQVLDAETDVSIGHSDSRP